MTDTPTHSIDFQETYDFTGVERRFLPILAAHYALAVRRDTAIRSAAKRLVQLPCNSDTEKLQAALTPLSDPAAS